MGKKCYRDLSKECVGEDCMAYQVGKESKTLGYTPPSGCVFIMSATLVGTTALFELRRSVSDMELDAAAAVNRPGDLFQKLILEKMNEARERKAKEKKEA